MGNIIGQVYLGVYVWRGSSRGQEKKPNEYGAGWGRGGGGGGGGHRQNRSKEEESEVNLGKNPENVWRPGGESEWYEEGKTKHWPCLLSAEG